MNIKKILLILTFLLAVGGGRIQAAELKNYVYWWPLFLTPWAYKAETQLGGVGFMKYQRDTDFEKLSSQFKEMVETHKPDAMVVISDWRDWQPLSKHTSGYKLGEGNNQLKDIRKDQLTFDYFDDLLSLAKTNGIKLFLYPVVSAYGGQVAYPFSYYSKTGWFWKRPDWPYGLADPTTEAMRYPSGLVNGSTYDWCEHEAGYGENKTDCSKRHWTLTTDGIEDTGIGGWKVFESPDMVFNGYDVALHFEASKPGLLPLPLHSPIPSLSSETYRNITRDFFYQIGNHYRGKGVDGFLLFQEPSYAHLREQMNYKSGFTGKTESNVDSTHFEVDYSQAELNRYNSWRENKGLAKVENIPFPVDRDYQNFREDNLVDFMENLKDGLMKADPDAKIVATYYDDFSISGIGTNKEKIFRMLEPEYVFFEPPHTVSEFFSSDARINELVDVLEKTNSGKMGVFSQYIKDMDKDNWASQKFNSTYFWAPAVKASNDPEGYSTWSPNKCSGCLFRYKTPSTFIEPQKPTPKNCPQRCSTIWDNQKTSWQAWGECGPNPEPGMTVNRIFNASCGQVSGSGRIANQCGACSKSKNKTWVWWKSDNCQLGPMGTLVEGTREDCLVEGLKLMGDANGDGKVDLGDQAIWKKEYLEGVGKSADFNNDGKVDMADLGIWKTEYVE